MHFREKTKIFRRMFFTPVGSTLLQAEIKGAQKTKDPQKLGIKQTKIVQIGTNAEHFS